MDTSSATQEISLKSKKNEILDAYNRALEETEKLRKESRQQAELISKQKRLVENASRPSRQLKGRHGDPIAAMRLKKSSWRCKNRADAVCYH